MTAAGVFPYGVMVTVQRMARDRFGNVTVTSTHRVGPCAVSMTGSDEPNVTPQDTVTVQAVLYVPASADIYPTDRAILPDGTKWEVIGSTLSYTNPYTGWNPGGAVRIQRVGG